MLERRQIEEFFQLGFTVVPDLFNPEEVREMIAAFDRLEQTARALRRSQGCRGSEFVLGQGLDGETAIQRIVWCGAAEPVLSDYGEDSRLLKMAALLLGSWEMHQLINQAHFKLPGDGVQFPWHQDSSHRRFGQNDWTDLNGTGSYVQTVLALDDVTEDNGPLQLIRGSCKLGHLALPQDGTLPPGLLENAKTVTATMRAGSVLLFGPYTIHRSFPNESTDPRRVFINGYAYPGANSRVYPGVGAGRIVRAIRPKRQRRA
jgi:ectoine hydroxylase-related dioxygenase (phytanoyl-CoA dioxygenase family)